MWPEEKVASPVGVKEAGGGRVCPAHRWDLRVLGSRAGLAQQLLAIGLANWGVG